MNKVMEGHGLRFVDLSKDLMLQRDSFVHLLQNASNLPQAQFDDRSPKCGQDSQKHTVEAVETVTSDAIHVRCKCNNCGSAITKEFIFREVFIG
jgi:hypothetical protein